MRLKSAPARELKCRGQALEELEKSPGPIGIGENLELDPVEGLIEGPDGTLR